MLTNLWVATTMAFIAALMFASNDRENEAITCFLLMMGLLVTSLLGTFGFV